MKIIYQCECCGEEFECKYHITDHMTSHINEKFVDEKYKCPEWTGFTTNKHKARSEKLRNKMKRLKQKDKRKLALIRLAGRD